MAEREQQLGDKGLKRTDIGLPQKDVEAFNPRFGLTRDIIKHLQDAGISERSYDRFIRGFDAYLKHSATTENLNAIGVVGVPSIEGAASMIVEDGGFVLNAVTCWSLPNEAFSWFNGKKLNPAVSANHNEWIDLGDIPDKELVTTFNYVPLSSEDYPTLEQVRVELEDPAIRREKFTLSVDLNKGSCEFWGLVTTEQLRQEMASKVEIGSFAVGKERDFYIPQDTEQIVEGFSQGLQLPALRDPLQALLEKASQIKGLYAIALGLDNSSPSGLLNLDIHYFTKLEEDDPNGTFEAIREAKRPLIDAEYPENWRELNQSSRGIGGQLTTGSWFVNCDENTIDEAIKRFKEGELEELIPMHLEPLLGVVVLRIGERLTQNT